MKNQAAETYTIRDDAGGEETVEGSMEDAIARAAEIYTPNAHHLLNQKPQPTDETTWWHVTIQNEHGESVHAHYPIEPPKPECNNEDGHHEWIDGGSDTTAVCRACRWTKHQNSWAQCHDCSTQGLTSTRYSRT